MKDIVVLKKTEELHKYDLWITFDKDEELDDWLRTTLENKDNLLIVRQYKFRKKGFKCCECGETSSAEDINKATKNYFGGDIMEINNEYNRVGSDFICPHCKEIVAGDNFRKINE
jgi:hypothetical protein